MLRVKPQITEGGTRAARRSTRKCRASTSTSNPAGIITNKRSLESSVIVDDGQIIVLGGLIQDALTDGTDKVPVLGDMPLPRRALPLRRAQAREDQPDDLPQADRRRGPAGDGRVITVERYDYLAGEQQQQSRRTTRLFWRRPRRAARRCRRRRRRCAGRRRHGPRPDAAVAAAGVAPPRRGRAAGRRAGAAAAGAARRAATRRARPSCDPAARARRFAARPRRARVASAARIPYAFARAHGVLAARRARATRSSC